MKSHIPKTTSETNSTSGPDFLRGKEAVEAAKVFSLPLHRWGHYLTGTPAVEASEGVEAVAAVPGKWFTPPPYTPEERAAILDGTAPAHEREDFVKACSYRGHTLIVDGPEPRIVDDEGETVCHLHERDGERVAAVWLDAYLLGRESGEKYGITRGQYQTEQKVRDVAALMFGPLFTSLERVASHLEESTTRRG